MALSTIPTRALSEQGINFRNLIINGDMSIAQRGTSFSGMTTGQYTLDRWGSSPSGGNLTMSQQSFTGTDIDNFNSKNYIRLTVNTANNNCGFVQYVEDAKRFLGKTVTLSFKAKGTNPAGGVIETAIACYTGSGGSYTTENRQQYSVTSDWQTFSFTTTIQSASGLTINDADSYMYVYPVIQPTGDTSTTSWEVDVAEVQVEYGNTSSSFEVVPYDVNFKRCARYFQTYQSGGMICWSGTTISGANYFQQVRHLVQMRTSATIGNFTVAGLNGFASGDPSIDYGDPLGFRATKQSNGNTNEAYFMYKYTADAEF